MLDSFSILWHRPPRSRCRGSVRSDDQYTRDNMQLAVPNQHDGLWLTGTNFTDNNLRWLPVTTLSADATWFAYTAGGTLNSKLLDNKGYTLLVRSSDTASNMQAV